MKFKRYHNLSSILALRIISESALAKIINKSNHIKIVTVHNYIHTKIMNTIPKHRPILGLFNNLLKTQYSTAKTNITEDLAKIVKNNKVVVFMKGVPDQPRCGFSNAVVQIMRMHGVQYDAHDVLKDENLRQGVKDFSNWPTIPQVYIDGEFVGGCDILLQMHQSGDLVESLEKAGIKSALLDKVKEAATGTKDKK